VVLLVLAGIGVIAALEGQDSPVVSVTTEPSTPEPTGVTASSDGENPPPPTPSDTGVITTIPARPGAGASGRPSASKGSTSSSPKPTSPGTPTLTRKDPTPEELHSSDGKVTLVLGGVAAGTGTVASITLSYDGRQQTVAVQPDPAASYEVPVENLEEGRTYAFTAQVCNSAKLCTVTDAPFEFTPYGAAKVQAPSIKFVGPSLTITVPAVDRHANPNDPSCFLALSATPADSNAPQRRRVWFGGDTVQYDGKAATTYTATVTCETAGISDGSASSTAITTPAAPPPSTTPPASVTPTTAAAAGAV
jgi:hypothetical protein